MSVNVALDHVLSGSFSHEVSRHSLALAAQHGIVHTLHPHLTRLFPYPYAAPRAGDLSYRTSLLYTEPTARPRPYPITKP